MDVEVERRRSKRIPLLTEAEYECNGAFAKSNIADIGLFGVFIYTESPLREGEKLKLSFALPDGHVVVSEGLVAHCQPGLGMGIAFTTLKTEDLQRIEQLLDLFGA
jgi:hypothetical protein